eukprot:TRINITY_DN14401_c0_g1_i1.p1 TRINITY_DN14401_c0_g1~~TRINITY_DN14401_c0_g1_i1.p1  ORF type:complete len:176 (+),score=45.10 TRINITY_DN14401_c0_g1_i1:76-603(+)
MYRLAERHKLESLARPQDWAARIQCLASCSTTLALLPDGMRGFLYDSQLPPPLYGKGGPRGAGAGTLIPLATVRRELLRAKVELDLCRATVQQWAPAGVSPLKAWSRLERVGDLVALLVDQRLFATAVSLCMEYHGGAAAGRPPTPCPRDLPSVPHTGLCYIGNALRTAADVPRR